MNDFRAHHGLRFPLKRTKTTLSTLLWFHLLLFWLIFFPSATVACCGPSRSFSFFSSIRTWQQGKLLSKHRGNLLAADSKVLFVLTHAGLFELFAVTHVFLHVLLKWKWYPHVLVCSLQQWVFEVVLDFFLLRIFLKSATLRRVVLESPDFYIWVAISFVLCSLQETKLLLGYCVECCSTVERLYWNWTHRKLFCHHLPKMLHTLSIFSCKYNF